MEDQPADPGDLTTAAPVPQGKAARSRHRLPRQKLRQEGQDDPTDSDAPNVAEVPEDEAPVADAAEIADSVQEAPPSVEAPNTTAAVVESRCRYRN